MPLPHLLFFCLALPRVLCVGRTSRTDTRVSLHSRGSGTEWCFSSRHEWLVVHAHAVSAKTRVENSKCYLSTPFQILGVGLTITTELIGYFEGEERAEEQAEEELPWTSREVLAGAGFSQKSDVYSFGIVLWEIMQKEPRLPYAGLLPSEVRVASRSSNHVSHDKKISSVCMP